MAGILDFNISGKIGGYDLDVSNQPDPTGAQEKYERQKRKERLIWIGVALVAGYFAYTSFFKK